MSVDVTKIVGPVLSAVAPVGQALGETWAVLIGDRVAAWRLRNAASLQRAVIDEAQRFGLTVDRSRVPERYAITWFEEATKQDEPEIQELFARLLTKAANGDADALDRRHLDMLTRFTPIDAQTFQWFYAFIDGYKTRASDEFALIKAVKIEIGESSTLSIEHLITLGALERRFDTVERERFDWHDQAPHYGAKAEIMPTEMGMSLARALRSSES